MRRLSAFLFLLAGVVPFACAQNTNPQTTWSSQVFVNSPSVYLNFNDPTSTFNELISNTAFISSVSGSATVNAPQGTIYGGGGTNFADFMGVAPANGTVSSITITFSGAPSPGAAITIMVGTLGSGPTITVTNSFVVTAAGSTTQTFVAGTDFTSFSMAAGQYLGYWSNAANPAFSNPIICCDYQQHTSTAPTGTSAFSLDNNNQIQMSYVINYTTSSGTVTPLQPGMKTNNFSAAFPYNGWRAAPNNTMGAVDWSAPWTILDHIDNLQYDRTGSLILASKGDLASGSSWSLFLQMNGLVSQLCFQRVGTGTVGVTETQCSAPTTNAVTPIDWMPNGFNYDIVVTDTGTGNPGFYPSSPGTSAITIYVNGSAVSSGVQSGGYGFGALVPTVTGGTGYANDTAFNVTGGGGPNCHASGVMRSSGGVPFNVSANWYPTGSGTWGCTTTSGLTYAFTGATGTGATLSFALNGASMNSTTLPLMVPGYVSGGSYLGVGGTDTTQGTTYVDEFATFPGVLNQTQVQSLFYQSEFFRRLLGTPPANPVSFVFVDDGCGDPDDFFALQSAVRAQQLGYIQIEGAVADTTNDVSIGIFRQMLDQAGLANIPVGYSNPGQAASGSSGCSSANLTAYNASTPQTVGTGAYPTAATVLRTVMAANPTTPVNIFSGTSMNSLAQFMQSPADGISSMTGLQLWNQNAANGGVAFLQGGQCNPSSFPATSPCSGDIGIQYLGDPGGTDNSGPYVYANHGAMPLASIGGTPWPSGPGISVTRAFFDPMFLFVTTAGSDIRTGWDSLPMAAFISPYFSGGVTVGFSGGTGYANQTFFTSTGGGANCQVAGIMTASGGVPNGIESVWGLAQNATDSGGLYPGLGWGCLTPPTIVLTSPTGTGVVLTAYTTRVCGTETATISPPTDSFVSTPGSCTTNVYEQPMSVLASPASAEAPIFTWFLNSLVDPIPNGRVLAPQ
ncbi:hypothetical protein [Silvimonas sp.]|uniref:hypothetical protein n=1 Tax=Silvimonas sp. TaxID=2650811 RepID=UPI00284B4419|nr:hypothetical protein [Silvimonas sp.]MDR3426094.1 hypothetical protein [Silvimonas sp.]